MQATAPVLVVDLDGTLCRTDTLHEALIRLALRHPGHLPGLAGKALAGDKPGFKAQVADLIRPAPDTLVFNADVIALITRARDEGRQSVREPVMEFLRTQG